MQSWTQGANASLLPEMKARITLRCLCKVKGKKTTDARDELQIDNAEEIRSRTNEE
jgi:hypothetical protein